MPDPRPRELLLLRHAKSAWDTDAPTDLDRPLSGRGKKDAPRMGAWLAGQGWLPDVVVSSPAKRARKTAKKTLRAMDLGMDVVRIDDRVYGATVGMILSVLQEAPADARRVMLVGHNPTLEEMVEWLAAEEPPPGPNGKLMPTCTVARLAMPDEWHDLSPGDGHLLGIHRPREVFPG